MPGVPSEDLVYDLLYIVGTLVFFALMLAYTAACASLGASDGQPEDA